MLNNFNLIATTYRYREFDAIDEMLDLLDDIGDSDAFFEVTNISGLITGKTNLDPFQVIEKFKSIIRSEDWRFRYVLRVIPIESVTNSNPSEIAMAALSCPKGKRFIRFLQIVGRKKAQFFPKVIRANTHYR